MAAARTQTLFGFGADLDWRPTCFVTPFPLTSVCSACSLVPSTVATLACRHFLCRPCYDRSVGKHGHCPLDMEPLHDEDVVWSTVPKDSVLALKVRCWNFENGCDAEDVATVMLDHFANGCQFHAVNCPRCGVNVLHRGIPDHLDIGCTALWGREEPLIINFAKSFLGLSKSPEKPQEESAYLCTKMDLFEEER